MTDYWSVRWAAAPQTTLKKYSIRGGGAKSEPALFMGEADPVGVTQQKKNTHEQQLVCLPPSHTLTHTHQPPVSPLGCVWERQSVSNLSVLDL